MLPDPFFSRIGVWGTRLLGQLLLASEGKATGSIVVVNGCGVRVWGVAMMPALHVSVQPVQEHIPRQYQTDRQLLICGVNASHGDSLSTQNCCC